ncbi:transmembrane protein 116 isoform X3 [Siniperca chuatsi]|nr:transmembrane protein 116 isoform X3 [Siniperca chuatsi]XP_044062777.1 transmembrane protein 116 isoform X3 [Siniperca chuatsi]XP_044062778.1 transmembrane protein 116 isoform X3 [Siniperca chuatsi]XP_044062779.1 transmembrane protein 116 isoform X3 [Siniperca chuatsi]
MSAPRRLQEAFTNSTEENTTAAQDWTEVYEAIGWIQLVMAALSILGSGSIIVCVMLQRLSRTPELQPLFLLSVSDLLLALCWLIGAALFSQHCSSLNTHCYHLHTVEQILYMASFFYTLNYVWNLYTGIREKFYSCMNGYPVQFSNRVSTAGKITALLSGLFPVLLMTPVFIQGNISQCQANFSEPYRCLLMHTGALYLTSEHQQPIRACSLLHTYCITIFLATFFLTLLSIVALVVKARRIYRRVVTSNGFLGNQQRASFSVMDRRMLLYPLIFVLCWGPAVGLALLQEVKPSAGQGKVGVALYISQAFTSASQGFLNCLVYGWTRARLRRAGRRVLSRDVDTQTPLLRSQKKRSYQTLRTIG